MTRTIVIDPVTRIEGHSKITIQLDERGEVADAHFHVTQFRGFERITQGRPVHEMPALMARICGICPVSHLVASAKAVDDIMAVEPTPTGADLRRVINLGQIVQSNALSFFHLSSPDLLFGFDADPAVRNIIGVARANPGLARDGIGLRKWGQQIIEWVAGKRIHPEGIVPGGVAWPLTAEIRDRILAGVPEAIASVERAIAWYKSDMMRWEEEAATFGNFRSAFMGLVDREGNVDHYGGWLRVVDADGKFLADRVDPKLFNDYIGEAVEPWSYLKSTYWKAMGYPDGIYRVGPLARLNVADRTGTPRADEELEKFRWRVGRVAGSSFHYHYARLIDTLHAIEKIEELLRGPDILDKHVRSVRRHQPTRGHRRLRGAAGHPDAPLQGGRRRHRPVGEPRHRHGPQQHGDEPRRPPGGAPPRQGRDDHGADAQPGRGRDPLLRPVPLLLDPRPGPDGAPDPAAGARREGAGRAGPLTRLTA